MAAHFVARESCLFPTHFVARESCLFSGRVFDKCSVPVELESILLADLFE